MVLASWAPTVIGGTDTSLPGVPSRIIPRGCGLPGVVGLMEEGWRGGGGKAGRGITRGELIDEKGPALDSPRL